jgi:CHAT domain-containing protein
LLLARWLRGEAARAAGRAEAGAVLNSVLVEAESRDLPQISYRCLTSLGLLAQATGDLAAAESAFERSVAVIESLRAPLPAEEFRAAFLFDKLTPFSELARLALGRETPDGPLRALEYVERARSRALVDMLVGAVNVRARPRDAFEAELLREHDRLREELQWYYSQINRSDGAAARGPEALEELYAAVREREARSLDIRRRIEQRGGRLRFQLSTLRYARSRLQRHIPQLVERVRYHLSKLYDILLRRLDDRLGDRRLVIVPHRALHYVPFHALHDGFEYVVKGRAVSYAPSAAVLQHCLERPAAPMRRALLVGVADEQMPRVRDEVEAISQLFPEPVVLLDSAATVSAVREVAPTADVVHLACHGQFRPDNPLFSSLRLGDGWLTVRDAYDLDLSCGLVALSACETGTSAVRPGEELIGLARGFFSAGTPSLLVSLWTVDDTSTAELMVAFYRWLGAGLGPSEALAHAQRELMERFPHPYFWSAFAVLGRW